MAIFGGEVPTVTEQYTIAQARDGLTRLVRRAESRAPVILTRRGKPVAVLLSYDEFNRLKPESDYLEALEGFRRDCAGELEGLAEALDNLRDASEGREVPL